MKLSIFSTACAVIVAAICTSARADDDSEYVWHTDQGIQKASATQQVTPVNLTQALIGEDPVVPGVNLAPAVKQATPSVEKSPEKTEQKLPAVPSVSPATPRELPVAKPNVKDVPAPEAAPAKVAPKPVEPPKPTTPPTEVRKPVPPPPVGNAPETPTNPASPVAGANQGQVKTPSEKPVAPTPPPSVVIPPASEVGTVEEANEDEPFKLFRFPSLESRRINISGWLEQGFTWNPDSPANRFNGPVGYNDRSNEYMLNQFYFIAERTTNTDEDGWDIGGRVDMLYGEDWRFVQAFGLENEFNSNQDHRFYGLGLPQFYADLAYEKLTLRGGHFYAPLGYETATAPDNFFYSHSYSFLYAQPTTLSGGMLKYQFNDKLSVNAGIDTGWNDWDAKNGKLGYFSGFNFRPDDKTSIALEMNFSNEQPSGIASTRFHYSLVVTRKLSEKLTYGMEHNFGHDSTSVAAGEHAEWWGFAQYLLYQLNDRWAVGARYEWLTDEDGVIVNGLGDPHGIPLVAAPATWNDLSFGVNFKPNKNILVRSEARWDWIDLRANMMDRPFDDFTNSQQFLWGNDLIVRF